MTERYECDNCGACCTQLIIEIDHLDVVREPKLLAAATLLDGHGKITYDSDWEKQYGLACGSNRPCPLHVDNRCSIYPTRPNCCVAAEAGGMSCQEARGMAGLEPLKPIV
jgi:Fe-S-cluster containining protein